MKDYASSLEGGLNACLPAALTPDPDGGFTITFRDVPEAITEGDTRGSTAGGA
jgi:hypothetical protein